MAVDPKSLPCFSVVKNRFHHRKTGSIGLPEQPHEASYFGFFSHLRPQSIPDRTLLRLLVAFGRQFNALERKQPALANKESIYV